MELYKSSRNIALDDDKNLVAECVNSRNEWENSIFPLNDHISNTGGGLSWGGKAFKDSTKNVSITGGRYLRAELRTVFGFWITTIFDLGLYIDNDDGILRAKEDRVGHLADDSWHGACCYVINEGTGTSLELFLGKCCSSLHVDAQLINPDRWSK